MLGLWRGRDREGGGCTGIMEGKREMNLVCRVEGAKKWKSLVLRSWRERGCWSCGGRKIEMVQDQWLMKKTYC